MVKSRMCLYIGHMSCKYVYDGKIFGIRLGEIKFSGSGTHKCIDLGQKYDQRYYRSKYGEYGKLNTGYEKVLKSIDRFYN